ncbi:hypothetical protein GQ53DRAFT_441358 [Thozetella sp. PMI_491]|nr:hypothetical protein GQ53DRAFT_441358 [Thozetella sp. PMI_491]
MATSWRRHHKATRSPSPPQPASRSSRTPRGSMASFGPAALSLRASSLTDPLGPSISQSTSTLRQPSRLLASLLSLSAGGGVRRQRGAVGKRVIRRGGGLVLNPALWSYSLGVGGPAIQHLGQRPHLARHAIHPAGPSFQWAWKRVKFTCDTAPIGRSFSLVIAR